ncbi:MAG: hypothetical protein FJY73_08170 [Candidatus Eisenbacteria bacterium]|nr:hypothetical protein [Candidatus Eisenbacteria bacterium]
MKQFVLTPAAGKRLIAQGIAAHPAIGSALKEGTIVIVAGSTNGYVAEEVLARIGRAKDFSKERFFRGVTLPPARAAKEGSPPPAAGGAGFPGDVVIAKGAWLEGKTIFDVVDDLREGDVVLKGANALDLAMRRAAIFVLHPKAGTIGAAVQAAVGRRVRLILPVGVEKRVDGDLDDLAARVNAPSSRGPCLFPVPGEVFTELDAIALLTGASAAITGAGGIGGAEGCVWLGVEGTPVEVDAAEQLISSVAGEPPFPIE